MDQDALAVKLAGLPEGTRRIPFNLDVTVRKEVMAGHMTKFHLGGLPVPAVLHKFTAPDMGDPHDHPWSFRSMIICGGYVEEVYEIGKGLVDTIHRKPGDSFLIDLHHIHRIIELPLGECWTLILPQSGFAKTSGFYRFSANDTYHRFWNESEFKKL